jgi:predicted dehydrogenase
MEALARSGLVEITAIADASETMLQEASTVAPKAELGSSLDELLKMDLDALVIATPSAMHAEQSMAALERGLAVFCQKPLGRNAAETRQVVTAANAANRLLGVDLSYRFLEETRCLRELVQSGELGEIYAVDLVFHNAYGPDKPWFYDWTQSGGGCVMDLGIHLVDLAMWVLNFPRVTQVASRLFAQGKPVHGRKQTVEDFATARLDLETGAVVQMACSWKLPAGRDAVISGTFFGSKRGACFRNLDGSFYKFTAERFRHTKTEVLAGGDTEWGGRAVVNWAERLTQNSNFDPHAEEFARVAEILDAVYET